MLQKELKSQTPDKTRGPFVFLYDLFLTRRGVIAYLPILLVIICMFFGGTVWQIFLPRTDPARYQCYALTFWFGSGATHWLPQAQCSFLPLTTVQGPFHMLPLEYPPLTLLLFSLPLLPPLAYYQLWFAVLMSLLLLLLYWLLRHFGPKSSAPVFALYTFLGAIATAQVRYDLLPATLTLLCLIAAERKHWRAAYLALVFAVLFKIYPILLLPALFLAEQQARGRIYIPTARQIRALPQDLLKTLRTARRWHWSNIALFFGVLVGVTGFFALFNVQGAVVDQLSYFVQRPIQIEAFGSTFLWLGSYLGSPFSINDHYGSLNIVSALGNSVSSLGTLLLLLGCTATLWLQWRGRLDVTQACIALLLIFIATGKVFSPQYLIWVIPLLAYAGVFNRIGLILWCTISLATTFVFAYFYTRPVTTFLEIPLIPGFFEAVTLRNALFVFFTLAYLCNWFQLRQRKALPITSISER